MMANSSLIQWLATFQLDGRASIEPDNDACYHLADGFVCARILNQICPRYFTDRWLDGIKPVPPNGSWRLRVSNLKRILQKIHDYASDLQSPQFKPDAITPDVAVIAQNFDADQISRLIQLILFCAINCEKKQAYIETIGNLPTQVKQDIKEAIEELLVKDSVGQRLNASHGSSGDDSIYKENGHSASTSSQRNPSILSPARGATSFRSPFRRDSSQSIHGDISKRDELDSSGMDTSGDNLDTIKKRLNDALVANDEKAQAFHELEMKMRQLLIEKEQLISENENLARDRSHNKQNPEKMRDFRLLPLSSRDGVVVLDTSRDTGTRSNNSADDSSQNLILQQNVKLQSEINKLKGDVIRLETEKEEYRLKSNLLKEDRDLITKKHDELRNKAEQAKRLQDELDEQRHISEKVISLEAMVENLIKKNNEMKREFKDSAQLNTERIQRIISLEEENKQLASEINRIEIYKKQLQDVQVKFSEETHRADKAEVELSRLAEKFDVVKKENERLYDVNSQFIRGSHATSLRAAANISGSSQQQDGTRSDKQYSPVNLKDNEGSDFSRLYGGDAFGEKNEKGDYGSLSKPVIELKDKIARLECENKLLQSKLAAKRENDQSVLGGLLDSANDRCAELESENRQSKKRIMMLEGRLKDLVSSGGTLSDAVLRDPASQCDNCLGRFEELQKLVYQKDNEIVEAEQKYRRNLAKAKELIKTLNNNQSLTISMHQSNASSTSLNTGSLDEYALLRQQLRDREARLVEVEREFFEFRKFKEIHERLIISAFYGFTTPMQWRNAEKRLERTTLTSPPNTASSSINNPKHSH